MLAGTVKLTTCNQLNHWLVGWSVLIPTAFRQLQPASRFSIIIYELVAVALAVDYKNAGLSLSVGYGYCRSALSD